MLSNLTKFLAEKINHTMSSHSNQLLWAILADLVFEAVLYIFDLYCTFLIFLLLGTWIGADDNWSTCWKHIVARISRLHSHSASQIHLKKWENRWPAFLDTGNMIFLYFLLIMSSWAEEWIIISRLYIHTDARLYSIFNKGKKNKWSCLQYFTFYLPIFI